MELKCDSENGSFPESFDVIVVGAGAAGIGSAVELQRVGKHVVVLEARQRVGGRAYTSEEFCGMPLDLGGQWIHCSSKKNPMFRAAKARGEIGRKVVDKKVPPNCYQRYYVDSKGQLYHPRKFKDAAREANRLWGYLEDHLTLREDVSVETALKDHSDYRKRRKRLNPTSKMIFDHMIEAIEEYEGAPAGELSAIGFAEETGSLHGPDRNVARGYGGLVKSIAKDSKLDIRLGVKVLAVRSPPQKEKAKGESGGLVVIVEGGKQFLAKRVVVAVPLGVLQQGSLKFEPCLPQDFRKSLAVLGTADYNKIVLHFDAPFKRPLGARPLEQRKKGGGVRNVEPFIMEIMPIGEEGRYRSFRNQAVYCKQNVWIGYTTNQYGRAMKDLTDEEVLDHALELFRVTFGKENQVFPKLKAYRIMRWNLDPLSLGSWTFVPFGGKFDDIRQLAKGVPDAGLYFAGEHTCASDVGTVHGAYMSGERAAKQAIKSLSSVIQ